MSSLAFNPGVSSLTQPKTNAASATSSSSSTPSVASDQTSLNALGSTFMQLLVQELQNQDPTAPMDSTQMVGQMISLNQLDQVASINQLLTTTLGKSTTPTSTAPAPTPTPTPTPTPAPAPAPAP